MKDLFKSILHGVLLFTAFYLIGAFINSDFNINTWTLDARVLVGVVGGALSIILTLASYQSNNY